MIEGRPRESLVQYENPIEVNKIAKFLTIIYRSQLDKILMIPLRKHLDVRIYNFAIMKPF